MNAHTIPVRAIPETRLDWAHAPSPYAWGVMIYGGQCPRTGADQPAMQFQFYKRLRVGGAGYSRKGILWRANDYARYQHRACFAVRDTDGTVIYAGPVLDEIEGPKVFARLSDDGRKDAA
jgi:hypothetical protein